MPIKVTETPRQSFGVAAIALPGTSRRAVEAGALAMKRSILAGSPRRLRGVGENGAPLNVRYDVKGERKPTALVRAVGPWQLIENDTRAHLIVSKKLGGTRRRRTGLASGLFVSAPGRRLRAARGGRQGGVRIFPGEDGVRAYARHPGTKGQRPWAKGVERGTPAATLAMVKVVRDDFRRQFG